MAITHLFSRIITLLADSSQFQLVATLKSNYVYYQDFVKIKNCQRKIGNWDDPSILRNIKAQIYISLIVRTGEFRLFLAVFRQYDDFCLKYVQFLQYYNNTCNIIILQYKFQMDSTFLRNLRMEFMKQQQPLMQQHFELMNATILVLIYLLSSRKMDAM
ncbi:Hypothetical_protein [Hexamita inflata]|uniref:Hypothetical_protein n=1 Tax=Hexamita inflata TaxID=28002 RepID=A0AA86V421_9EUKA|nr:Hypothetical protein HINF_LOCUS43863 [Hexamita inflata]